MLVEDVVGGSVWKFVYDVDGPAFLERELVGLGVDHVCRQHETAYQLVLKSRQSTSNNLSGPPPPILPVPPLAAPANTGQSSSTPDEGRSAG